MSRATAPKSDGPRPRLALDTSAVLAMMRDTPGGSVVGVQIHQAAISSVNWTEVVDDCRAHDVDADKLRLDLEEIGLSIVPFTSEDARQAAEFWDPSRKIRLSLSDRACLALAKRLGVPVMTAVRAWRHLAVGVEIRLLP